MHPSPNSPRPRLPALDGLRGVAACGVVAFHLTQMHHLDPSRYLSVVREHFGIGVPLFFVLSAFSLYYADFEKTRTPEDVRRFLLKRFLRIAPLYYVMLLFCLVYRTHVQGMHYGLSEIAANVLFAFSFLPGKETGIVWASWSIGIEFPFYVLLPVIFCLVRSLRCAVFFLAFTAALSLVSSLILAQVPGRPDTLPRMSPLPHVVFFGMGTYAYFAFVRLSMLPTDARRKVATLIGGIAVAILLAFFADAFEWRVGVRRLGWYMGGLGFAVLTVAMALGPWRVLASRTMGRLGELSYSIYLVHVPVIHASKALYAHVYGAVSYPSAAFLLCFVYTLGVVLAIAAVTYRLIERPAMHLGKRLTTSPASS